LLEGMRPPKYPKDVVSAQWYEVPRMWWNTIERLSWTMMGSRQPMDVSLGRFKLFIIDKRATWNQKLVDKKCESFQYYALTLIQEAAFL